MSKHYRYFFDKGYGLVPAGHLRECRNQLIEAICPGRSGTFYTYLANGVRDIRLPLYEEITSIIKSYGVNEKKIWRKEMED